MPSLVPHINKNLRDSERRHVSITIHCEAQTGREDRQVEQKRNPERPGEHRRGEEEQPPFLP